jgi:hypothetical protein
MSRAATEAPGTESWATTDGIRTAKPATLAVPETAESRSRGRPSLRFVRDGRLPRLCQETRS